MGEGPACGIRKKETSILISCLGRILSVSLTSISPSSWIRCREDTAAQISDVPLFSSFFFFNIQSQGHAADYWGEETQKLDEARVGIKSLQVLKKTKL